MQNFDDDFDKDFARTEKAIYIMWVFGALVSLATLLAIGYAVYRILAFFGIM